MDSKKVIAVFGATGAQGGGLARAISNDPEGLFTARAVTRNPDSDKAKALAQLGAEVVSADLDDLQSLESAMKGAWGAFCVTNYWEHFSPDKEIAQAANLATAASTSGLEHVIWSTLEDSRDLVPLDDDRMPTLMESYKVPHFDTKGQSNHTFTKLGVPVTFLLTSFYWDNFVFFGLEPKRDPDGVLALTLPMGGAKLPGIAAEDIGKCAYGIFLRSPEFIGKTVGIAGEHLTGAELAAAMTRHFGQEVRYNEVSPDVFRSFGFPGADDLGNMFQYKRDFEKEFTGARSVALSRELNPELQSFDDWLSRNKDRIPIK